MTSLWLHLLSLSLFLFWFSTYSQHTDGHPTSWVETTFSHKASCSEVWVVLIESSNKKPSLSQSNCPWWIPQNCKNAFCPSNIHYVNAGSSLGGAARATRALNCRATSPAPPLSLSLCPSNKAYDWKILCTNEGEWSSKLRGNQETPLFNLRISMNSCWEREHNSFLPFKFTLYI